MELLARPRVRRADETVKRPARRTRRGGNTRAKQALELVHEKPGITIPELAKAMKIEPNYLYRVLPRLASDGQVKRDGQGWHPAEASTSTGTEPVRNVPARKRTRGAKSTATASTSRTKRTQRAAKATSTTNHRAHTRRYQGLGARRARSR